MILGSKLCVLETLIDKHRDVVYSADCSAESQLYNHSKELPLRYIIKVKC